MRGTCLISKVSGFKVSGLRGLFVALKLNFKINNRSRKPETLKPETYFRIIFAVSRAVPDTASMK